MVNSGRHFSAIGKHSAGWLALAVVLALDMTARAGSINGSDTLYSSTTTPLPSPVDLTTLGTDDWAVWGSTSNQTQGSTTPYDMKNAATHDIQGMTLIGGLTAANTTNRTDQPGTYTWSNGTNTANQSSALPMFMQDYPPGGGPSSGLSTGVGFQWVFTADSTLSRTLTLTLGYVDVNATLTASLSDSSATEYTSNLSSDSSGTASFAVYTITYYANSPGQTLTVDYYTTANNGSYNNISVESAALSATSVPEPATLSLLAAGASGLLLRPRSRHRCV